MSKLVEESYFTECHECDAECEGVGQLDKDTGDLYGLKCNECGNEFDVLNWFDTDEEEEE